MSTQAFDSFKTAPEGEQSGTPVAAWSEFSGKPDYSAQGDPTQAQGQAFDSFNSQPQYEKQGDLTSQTDPVFDDPGRAGRSYTRESSGATGARSGSVSRDRAQQDQRGRGDAIEYGADSRRVTSPHRAMGARSTSRDYGSDSPQRGRHDLPTTDSGATGFRSTSSSRQVSEAN